MTGKTAVNWAEQSCLGCMENPAREHLCLKNAGPVLEQAAEAVAFNKLYWSSPANIVSAAKAEIDDYVSSIGLSGGVIGYAIGDWRPTDLPNVISPLAIVPNRVVEPTVNTMSVFIAIAESLDNVFPQRDMNTRQAAVQQLMTPIPLYRIPLMSAGLVSEQASEIIRSYSKHRVQRFKTLGIKDSPLPNIYTLNTNLLDILDRLDPGTLRHVVRG